MMLSLFEILEECLLAIALSWSKQFFDDVIDNIDCLRSPL